jgi:hypothetical protein
MACTGRISVEMALYTNEWQILNIHQKVRITQILNFIILKFNVASLQRHGIPIVCIPAVSEFSN